MLTEYLFHFQNNSNKHARSMFLQKARAASEACANADFDLAVQLYCEAIDLDPGNHVLYSNRSAACIRTKHFEQAYEDGRKAAELQPGWSKVGRLTGRVCIYTITSLHFHKTCGFDPLSKCKISQSVEVRC